MDATIILVIAIAFDITPYIMIIDKSFIKIFTFDMMLNSRRFNSIIYKEENVYEDREVKEYIYEDALRQLLESERIKSLIRDFEQDMWNN